MDKIQQAKENIDFFQKKIEDLQKENTKLMAERYINKYTIFSEIKEDVKKYFYDFKFTCINDELLLFEKISAYMIDDIELIIKHPQYKHISSMIKYIKEIQEKQAEFIKEKYELKINLDKKQEEKKESKYILFIVMLIVVIIPIFFQFRGLNYFINFLK